MKAFYERFPGTELQATVAPQAQLEQKLLKNELDFALVEGISHVPVLVSEEYMEDRLEIICPADGSFRQGQRLSTEEFLQQKFLLREQGSGTRETFERALIGAGLSVTPVWEATSTTALVNAVISGLGIAVLPYRMVTGPLEKGLVVSVTVEGLSFPRKFRFLYHKEKLLTSSARAFLDLCRNYEEGTLRGE